MDGRGEDNTTTRKPQTTIRKPTTKTGEVGNPNNRTLTAFHSKLRRSPTLGFSFVCKVQPVQVHVEEWLMYLLLFVDPNLSQSYVQRADESLLFRLLDACEGERLPGVLKAGLVEIQIA